VRSISLKLTNWLFIAESSFLSMRDICLGDRSLSQSVSATNFLHQLTMVVTMASPSPPPTTTPPTSSPTPNSASRRGSMSDFKAQFSMAAVVSASSASASSLLLWQCGDNRYSLQPRGLPSSSSSPPLKKEADRHSSALTHSPPLPKGEKLGLPPSSFLPLFSYSRTRSPPERERERRSTMKGERTGGVSIAYCQSSFSLSTYLSLSFCDQPWV
jgi:hypothetical protein